MAETILEEAQRLTHGDRQTAYDAPERNSAHIAAIASAILKKPVSAKDCCMIMMAVKLSREMYKHRRDSCCDLAGYAWCLSRIEGDENYTDLQKNENAPSMAQEATMSNPKRRKWELLFQQLRLLNNKLSYRAMLGIMVKWRRRCPKTMMPYKRFSILGKMVEKYDG